MARSTFSARLIPPLIYIPVQGAHVCCLRASSSNSVMTAEAELATLTVTNPVVSGPVKLSTPLPGSADYNGDERRCL